MSDMTSNHIMKPVEDAQSILGNLNDQLKELNSLIQDLTPDERATLAPHIKKLKEAAQASSKTLEHPTITFASIGTTSSGKSTVLNGIIGAQIAPMDANELSAGLLMLEHHDEDWTLFEAGDDGEPSSKKLAVGESQVYAHLKNEMESTIAQRNQGVVIPPKNYLVRGPLFICDPGHPMRLALGDKVRLRVFDLPGLRTAQDEHNAPVIRQRIKQAFSIVLIDRTGLFDHEKRERLMQELDTIVNDIGGRDSLMAFLFNKIDVPNPGGKSVEEHRKEATQDIKKNLRLRHPDKFELTPFSGVLYYHSTRLLKALSTLDYSAANKIRSELLQDCGSQLEQLLKERMPADDSSPEYQAWDTADEAYTRLSKDHRRNVDSKPDELVVLARLTLDASKHGLLWDALSTRIQDNIHTVLLYPVMSKLNAETALPLATLLTHAKAGQINSTQQLEETISELNRCAEDISTALMRQESVLTTNINNILDTLRGMLLEGDSMVKHTKLKAQYDEQCRQCFKSVKHISIQRDLDELTTLTRTLTAECQNVAVNFLSLLELGPDEKKTKAASLVQEAFRYGGVSRANDVIMSITNLQVAGYKTSFAANGHTESIPISAKVSTHGHKLPTEIKAKIEEGKARLEELKEIERMRADLFLSLRKLLSHYAERWLKAKLVKYQDTFVDMAEDFAFQAWGETQRSLKGVLGSTFALDIMPKRAALPAQYNITIPEDIFSFPSPDTEQTVKNVGQDLGTRSFERGSCFTSTHTETVSGEITARMFSIPSKLEMERAIAEGVSTGNQYFYDKLFDWISSNTKEVFAELDSENKHILTEATHVLIAQIDKVEESTKLIIESWRKIENILTSTEQTISDACKEAGINS